MDRHEALSRRLALPVQIARVGMDGDHDLAVVGLRNGEICLVDVCDMTVKRKIPGGVLVGAVALDVERGLIAVGHSSDLRVLETAERSWLQQVHSTPDNHQCVTIAPDGTIAWGDDDGYLHVRAAAPPHAVTSWEAHKGVVRSVAFSPGEGNEIMSAGADGAIRCWTRGSELTRLIVDEMLPGGVWCARYGEDSNVIGAACNDGTAWLWPVWDKAPAMILKASTARAPELVFSRKGHLMVVLATTTGDRSEAPATVWDAKSGELLCTLPKSEIRSRAVACSPDGQLIATARDDRTVSIWAAGTGALLREISGLPWGAYELAFHRSERVLMAAGPGGEVVALDPISGEELATFRVHERGISGLALSEDGTKVITSGHDPWIGITDLGHIAKYIRGNEAYWRGRLSPTGGASGARSDPSSWESSR